MTDNYQAHPAQVSLARVFSSVTLLGPPMGDKLVGLIAHLFSPEEAEVARHLPFYYPKPLARISRRAGRSAAEIEPLLETMSERRVIYGGGKGYSLLPLIPGMFEYMLMNGVDTQWHRKYAELLVDLYATGYIRRYNHRAVPAVRNIPVQSAVEHKSRILDADLISEMIDRHEEMAVAKVCQCRQSMRFVGRDCRRAVPEDGCLIFGSFAPISVKGGNSRGVSKEEMRDIVTERWEKKLVFLTGNVALDSPNAVCTCCDCCCHFLETVNNFDGGMMIAPPHFLARVDSSLCNHCGKCARACNTHAHAMDNKKHGFDAAKCIGCGVCVGACKEGAIKMMDNPSYKPPSKGFKSLGLKLLPGAAISGLLARMSK